jgi:multiple sugar transport system permease protein
VAGAAARGEERAAYMFLAPWIAGFIFFLLIPLGWAVWLSFTDEQLLSPRRLHRPRRLRPRLHR